MRKMQRMLLITMIVSTLAIDLERVLWISWFAKFRNPERKYFISGFLKPNLFANCSDYSFFF